MGGGDGDQDGRLVPDRSPPTLPLPIPSRGVFLSLAPTRPAQKPPSKSWTGCLSLLASKLRPGPSGAGSAVRRRLLRVSREAPRSTRAFFLFLAGPLVVTAKGKARASHMPPRTRALPLPTALHPARYRRSGGEGVTAHGVLFVHKYIPYSHATLHLHLLPTLHQAVGVAPGGGELGAPAGLALDGGAALRPSSSSPHHLPTISPPSPHHLPTRPPPPSPQGIAHATTY